MKLWLNIIFIIFDMICTIFWWAQVIIAPTLIVLGLAIISVIALFISCINLALELEDIPKKNKPFEK